MEKPEMWLYLKASNYGKSYPSECYLCQRVRMIVRLKGLIQDQRCKEVFVDPRHKNNPSQNEAFRDISLIMFPVLRHNGIDYTDAEEIEDHLEKTDYNFTPFLVSDDPEANRLAQERSPISDFAKWVKADPQNSPKHLNKIEKFLYDIDDRLRRNEEENKGPFLDGETLKIPDCILLPKLYHMQIAAAIVCSEPVDIFEKFKHLSEYMREADRNPTFSETKPLKEDIQLKYSFAKNKKELISS